MKQERMMEKKRFKIGDKVKLTTAFIREGNRLFGEDFKFKNCGRKTYTVSKILVNDTDTEYGTVELTDAKGKPLEQSQRMVCTKFIRRKDDNIECMKPIRWIKMLVDKITNKHFNPNMSFKWFGKNVHCTSGTKDYMSVFIEELGITFSFDFWTYRLSFEKYNGNNHREVLNIIFSFKVYDGLKVVMNGKICENVGSRAEILNFIKSTHQ